MNLGKIRKQVNELLNDDGYEDELNDVINSVYMQAVNEPGVLIPALKGIGSVTTVVDDNSTTMITDALFSGKLLRFGDPTKVAIYPSLEALFDNYQDEGSFKNEDGDIEAVALEGNILWYQKIPKTATSYGILYYKNPTLLVEDTDAPLIIPDMYHIEILVYGTAAYIMDKIEDGIEGQKLNTQQFEKIYNRGIEKLRTFLGSRRKPNKTSVWDV